MKPSAVFDAYAAAIRRGDRDELLARFHPDYRLLENGVTVTLPDGQPFRREHAVDRLGILTRTLGDFSMEAEHLVETGDRLVSEIALRGTHEASFMDVAPMGRPIQWNDLSYMAFEDGTLREARQCGTTARAWVS